MFRLLTFVGVTKLHRPFDANNKKKSIQAKGNQQIRKNSSLGDFGHQRENKKERGKEPQQIVGERNFLQSGTSKLDTQ